MVQGSIDGLCTAGNVIRTALFFNFDLQPLEKTSEYSKHKEQKKYAIQSQLIVKSVGLREKRVHCSVYIAFLSCPVVTVYITFFVPAIPFALFHNCNSR